jgi:hypothetical protein
MKIKSSGVKLPFLVNKKLVPASLRILLFLAICPVEGS